MRSDRSQMTVAVYCGSSMGVDPAYRAAAEALGAELARGGHTLVYGGGDVGLMGVVADAVLDGGGEVIGVITEHLVGAEVAHRRLTRLDVVESMHERKARMVALADATVVLPGGFGTLDETFEVLTWNQLGLVDSAVVFFDVADYFAPLYEFVAGAVAAGFMKPAHGALIRHAASASEVLDLAAAAPDSFQPKWL